MSLSINATAAHGVDIYDLDEDTFDAIPAEAEFGEGEWVKVGRLDGGLKVRFWLDLKVGMCRAVGMGLAEWSRPGESIVIRETEQQEESDA